MRKLLLLLRLLYEAPANPVHRLVAYGRHGSMARIAVRIILLAEVGYLIWLTRGANARFSGLEYLVTTLGYHALMMPFLVVMAMWAFSRPFTAAQKQDLWLTRIPPREAAFGAVLLPTLAALIVILFVPAIFCVFGLPFYLFDFIPWAMDILTGEAQRRRSTGSLVLFGVWFDLYLYGGCAVVYLCTGLVAMRGLLVSLLRARGVTLVASVRALFGAGVAGAMAFQMLLFTIFLVGIDHRPHEIPALVIIHNILLMILILGSLIAGMVIGLGHHPARRWFAEAVSSNLDDWDWLASETSMVSQPDPQNLQMTSPLSARLLAILPRVAISTIAGAIFAATLLSVSDSRRALAGAVSPFSGEGLLVPGMLLSALAGALLAFRGGRFLSWRRPIPIAKGRMAGSVWGAAIVAGLFGHVPLFFWIAASQGAFSITLTSIFPVTAFALVTLLPVLMLYCMLQCMWRLRATRRWTTIGVVLTIILLCLCLWYPGNSASAYLAAYLMLPPIALAFLWLGGGGEWMYQMVFDEEHARMSDAPSPNEVKTPT